MRSSHKTWLCSTCNYPSRSTPAHKWTSARRRKHVFSARLDLSDSSSHANSLCNKLKKSIRHATRHWRFLFTAPSALVTADNAMHPNIVSTAVQTEENVPNSAAWLSTCRMKVET